MASLPKNLVVFDIDGTLTLTADLADSVFLRTVTSFLGIPNADTDWPDSTHGTDSGALNYLLRRHRLPQLAGDSLLSLQRSYMRALHSELSSAPPVRGAAHALAMIANSKSWSLAFATGNWLEPALHKLAVCGLSTHGAPIASSSDSHIRTEILRLAVSRSDSHDRVVYIGDRQWDKSAANDLGIPFIAIGGTVDSEYAIPDYQDMDLVWKVLEQASTTAHAAG